MQLDHSGAQRSFKENPKHSNLVELHCVGFQTSVLPDCTVVLHSGNSARLEVRVKKMPRARPER